MQMGVTKSGDGRNALRHKAAVGGGFGGWYEATAEPQDEMSRKVACAAFSVQETPACGDA